MTQRRLDATASREQGSRGVGQTAQRAAAAHQTDGSGAMFDRIAERYDLLNRVLSLGIDHGWRRRTVAALELAPHQHVLDLATGTADLAIAVARAQPLARVVGLDPSPRMLEVGERKLRAAGLRQQIELRTGNAEQLPFDDRSFDRVCIGFGIRNVPDRPLALREMRRVLRPDGRLAILELSEPRGGVLGPLARFHVHTIVPTVGALLSGAQEYRYLQRSIAQFPEPERFVSMMREAGLEAISTQSLTLGVCHLYVARPMS
jgi:demethylmenaquinone methyltransferase/2-methoxy-6-polyprenyl-1,4-benzoquinol methylase